MHKIDKTDLEIINKLQKDARQSYVDMAKELNVTEGTVYNRITKLKELGIIRRYVADIDSSKLGYDLTVLIAMSLAGNQVLQIENELIKESNITAFYEVTGEYNAVMIVKFKDREDLNKMLKKLSASLGVSKVHTMIVLNVVKEDHGITIQP